MLKTKFFWDYISLKNQFLVFYALIFLVPNFNLQATHIVGADMSYRALGNNTYIFTLNVYRDCGSLVPIESRQTIYYYSTNCVIPQDSLVLNSTNQGLGKDISPVCNSAKSTCRGGTLPGVEKYTFEDTVSLTTACRDWIFYYKECNRSNSITTIVAPGTKCLYIEARLNNVDAPNNSSPSFGNEPVSFVCTNRQAQLDNGAVETDGDLLRFKLVAPRTNTILNGVNDANILTYISSLSPQYPLFTSDGKFGFDSLSGSISFVPTTISRTVTALKVEEYRNGILIGSVMRDLQILVQDCSNKIPQLQKIASSNDFGAILCIGSPKVLNFPGLDSNANDSVTIKWNNPFSGASFSAPKGKGTTIGSLNWAPALKDTGLVLVNLTITDNNCPILGSSSAAYKILIKPSPKVELRGDTSLNCGVTIPVTAKNISGKPPFSLSWSGIPDTTRTVILGNGNHFVTVKDATGCTFTEPLNILGGTTTSVTIAIDSFCTKQLVTLTSTINPSPPQVRFDHVWKVSRTDTNPSSEVFNSTLTKPSFRFLLPGTYDVSLKITGTNQCSYSTNRSIVVCNAPIIDSIRFITPNDKPCFGQPVRFRISERISTCPVSQWTLLLRNNIFTSINRDIALRSDSFKVGQNTLKITGTTVNGCAVSSEFKFDVTTKPSVVFVKPSIPFPCNQPSVTLTVKAWKPKGRPLDSYRLTIITATDSVTDPFTTEDTITRDIQVTSPQLVKVSAKINGSSCEAIAIGSAFFPLRGDAKASVFCKLGDTTRFTSAPTSPFGIKSFQWDLSGGVTSLLKNPKILYPPGQLINVKYFVEDSSTCKDTVKLVINTRLPDTVYSILEDTICFATPFKFFTSADTAVKIDSWTWKGIVDSTTINASGNPNSTLVLKRPGPNPVSVRIRYKGSCIKRWTVDTVFVRSPVEVAFTMKNVCALDTSNFTAFQISDEFLISKYKWNFSYTSHNRRKPNIDSGEFVKQFFDTSGKFRIILTGINEKGCVGIFRKDTNIVLVSAPIFKIEGDCQDDSLKFINGDAVDIYENIKRFGYAFGDGVTQINEDGTAFHRFQNVGTYLVQFSAYSKEGCIKTYTDTLIVKPRPEVIYTTGLTPCVGALINLDASASKASTPNEQILERVWKIDADTVSRTAFTSTSFDSAGIHTISHYIKSVNGCTDRLTYLPNVLPSPTAGFIANEFELLDKDFLTFQNTSRNADFWEYRYGDGNIDSISDPSLASPVHYYVGGGEFNIIQIVRNTEGCADTATGNLKLRPYIALPSAFTPNGDNLNDVFKLQHRLIRKIDEYKVFNRFGEVVFQSNELDKVWDGKQNDVEVPSGAYLFLVKATSVFGEGLSAKGSVNIIR